MMQLTAPAVAAIGGGAGLLLWLYLIRRSTAPVAFGHLVTTVVCVGLICRIAFAIVTPAFHAPDEQAHFNYIKYLSIHHAFPVQHSQTNALSNDWEYYQPPLYYIACLPLYWITSQLSGGNAQIIVRSLRGGSILLWLINLHFTRRLLDKQRITDSSVRAFVLGMVSLLPTYATLSSSINNDNLLIALGGLFLYLTSYDMTPKQSVWLGVLLGAALLTKLTAVVYIFALALVLVVAWAAGKLPWATALSRALTVTSIAAVVWLPWGVRNVRLYGDITGESVANIPYHWTSMYGAALTIISYITRSFSSVSGIHNNIVFFPIVGFCLIVLMFVGTGCFVIQGIRCSEQRAADDASRLYMLAMSLSIIVNLGLVVRFGLLYNQGQGRFLYPMLIPISMFMAIGVNAISNTRTAYAHVVGFLVSYLLAFTGFSLAVFYTVPLSVLIQRDVRFP